MEAGIGIAAKQPSLPEQFEKIEAQVAEAHSQVDRMQPRIGPEGDCKAPEACGIEAAAARTISNLEALVGRISGIAQVTGQL